MIPDTVKTPATDPQSILFGALITENLTMKKSILPPTMAHTFVRKWKRDVDFSVNFTCLSKKKKETHQFVDLGQQIL